MRFLTLALCCFLIIDSVAQTPQVPHKLHFANLTLTIRDDARREIQKDVDALTQSPRHFNIKVERAKTYFPIIEKIFEEENLPTDFKYLALQESALIPDAVSVSKAVGFWQFKDFTAVEMGLRVDREVDERLNIVSSTRAAARYIKKNNTFFDNWLFALQAYQMGAGGVMRSEKDFKEGGQHVEITSKTYWYVKKYLAHKIAFEDAVNTPGQQVKILAYDSKAKQTLKDVAAEVSVNEDELRNYNKWLKAEKIPNDKVYTVIVPFIGETALDKIAPDYVASAKTTLPVANVRAGEETANERVAEHKKINGIQAVKARPGETASALAKRAGVSLASFLKYNEMTQRDKIKPGEYYFTGKKRARADEAYHKVEEGEDIWLVSQRYGVKVSKLKKYNHLSENEAVAAGTTLYLSSTRPANSKEPVVPPEVVEVSKEEFAWSSEGAVVAAVSVDSQAGLKTTDTLVSVPVADSLVSTAPGRSNVESISLEQANPSSSSPEEVKVEEILVQHVVKKGETLYGIAKMYNVGVMEIVELNNLNIQDGIKPDQVLQLKTSISPETIRAEPVEVFHEVQASDTLYSVARKYGVTIKELMDWNGKSDFHLSVGEKLRIMQKAAN